MNTKIDKNKIKNFFSYYSWLAILTLVVSFAGWYYVISAINAYAPNEELNFFIESYGLKNDKTFDDLKTYMKDDGVLNVEVYNYSPDSDRISDYWDAFGRNSDIAILHQKDLDDMKEFIKDSFIKIDTSLEEKMFNGFQSSYDFYTFESDKYAIKIYDSKDAEYNKKFKYHDWITFKKEETASYDYYMLFLKSSYNFGDCNENNLSENGIKAANYILKENTYEV